MTAPIAFRRATLADADAIAAVHVAAWHETYRGLIDDAVLDGQRVATRAAEWRARLDGSQPEPKSTWVALDVTDVVAFGSGGTRRGDWPCDGELLNLYALRRAHGRGVGRALVHRVAHDLHALGMRSMLVRVLATNPARHFYERLGAALLGESSHEVDGRSYLDRFYAWRDLAVLLRLTP